MWWLPIVIVVALLLVGSGNSHDRARSARPRPPAGAWYAWRDSRMTSGGSTSLLGPLALALVMLLVLLGGIHL